MTIFFVAGGVVILAVVALALLAVFDILVLPKHGRQARGAKRVTERTRDRTPR